MQLLYLLSFQNPVKHNKITVYLSLKKMLHQIPQWNIITWSCKCTFGCWDDFNFAPNEI